MTGRRRVPSVEPLLARLFAHQPKSQPRQILVREFPKRSRQVWAHAADIARVSAKGRLQTYDAQASSSQDLTIAIHPPTIRRALVGKHAAPHPAGPTQEIERVFPVQSMTLKVDLMHGGRGRAQRALHIGKRGSKIVHVLEDRTRQNEINLALKARQTVVTDKVLDAACVEPGTRLTVAAKTFARSLALRRSHSLEQVLDCSDVLVT